MKKYFQGSWLIKLSLPFLLVLFNGFYLNAFSNLPAGNHPIINKDAVPGHQSESGPGTSPVYVLRFNAGNTDSYLDCGKSVSFSPAEITLEAWLYLENRTGNYIFANESYDITTGPQGYVLRLNTTGNLEFAVGSNGAWEQLTSDTEIVALKEWVHIAASFDASNTMKIFINGIEANSKTISFGINPTTQNLFIGESPSWSGRRLTGKLYDLRIWNKVNSASEILSSMNSDLTGSETGLVANWKLDEGSGTIINDATTNFNITKGNGTEWVTFTSLEAIQKNYLLNQKKDSVLISSNGMNIVQWTIKNTASAGNAYLSTQSTDEAVLVYDPQTTSYIRDSIIIEALTVESVHFEIKVHFEIYPNKYQYNGEILLDKIITGFYNSSNGLYAENIYPGGGIIQATSYIWPASHLLRAMKFAYRVNPAKYEKTLLDYLVALDQYIFTRDGTTGYASYPSLSSTRFYDDNGLFIIQFADLCEDINSVDLLDDAKLAYFFNNDIRDSRWGIPQHEYQLGAGMLYSMAVNQTGLGEAMLHQLTGEQTYLTESANYYQQLNSPVTLIKNQQNNLFNQYTFYQNGNWSFSGLLDGTIQNGGGFRAYQTTHVIQHAIRLFQITGETSYLNDAVAMGTGCRTYFYSAGNGLNENSFWGGNDVIDAFLDLYLATGDLKWRTTSFDIIDFLITYGKDKAGYYPGDYNDSNGKWSLNRVNAMPIEINMMGQAAAASGMLHVAYFEMNPNLNIPGFEEKQPGNEVIVYPTIPGNGEVLNIKLPAQNLNIISIQIFSSDGQLKNVMDGNNINFDQDVLQMSTGQIQPGFYILKVNCSRVVYTARFIIE